MRILTAVLLVLAMVGVVSNGEAATRVSPKSKAKAVKIAASDVTTSKVVWEKTEWGELGVGEFLHAPFPDDSRTTGYSRRGKDYPYDPHYNEPAAAIAIPKGFDSKGSVDFIVICHGHINAARKFVVNNKMGEILHATGRNAVLVAPQGAKDVPDSCGGKFEKPGEFAKFMYEVMAVLKREGRVDQGASMGHVIVGGLSGGGRPLGFILDTGGLNDSIKEAWIIDGAYEQHDKLAKNFVSTLTTTGPQVLRSVFTTPNAADNADVMALIGTPNGRPVMVADDEQMADYSKQIPDLMRRNQILFIRSVLPHDAFKLTERYLAPLISTSRYLRAIPNPQ